MNKKAFTLAEVLITLSILGVVAAISIPNIITNFQDKADMTKLKKYYSLIMNNIDELKAVEGCQTMACIMNNHGLYDTGKNNNKNINLMEARAKLLIPELTLDDNSKGTKKSNNLNCAPKKLYSLDGHEYSREDQNSGGGFIVDGNTVFYKTFCTKSGVGVSINGFGDLYNDCENNTSKQSQCGKIVLYFRRGLNQKGILGRNVFIIHFDAYGNHPEFWGHKICNGKNPISNPNVYHGGSDSDGITCLYRVMKNNWKIDY